MITETPLSKLKLTGPRGPGLTINGTSINAGQGFDSSVRSLEAINAQSATTNVIAHVDTRGVLIVTNTSAERGANIEIGRGNSPYGNALGVRTGTHSGDLVIEETGFHNGDLSEGDPGDTVIAGFSTTSNRVTFGTTMLGGKSTPIDETYTTENLSLGLRDSDALDTDGTMSVSLAQGSVDGTDGNVIKLSSSGIVASNENAVVRGPALETNAAVALRSGDRVQFSWKAEGGEDAYDVYAYLLNVDTGEKQIVLDQTGTLEAETVDWTEVSATVERPPGSISWSLSPAPTTSAEGYRDSKTLASMSQLPGARRFRVGPSSTTRSFWVPKLMPRSSRQPMGHIQVPIGWPMAMTQQLESYATAVASGDSVQATGSSASLTLSGTASAANAVIRGPAIYNDTAIELAEDDVISIDYKATEGADQADVFIYLINEDTGETAELVNQTMTSSDWGDDPVVVPSAGNYRMVVSVGPTTLTVISRLARASRWIISRSSETRPTQIPTENLVRLSTSMTSPWSRM